MSKRTEGEWLISKLATPSWAQEYGVYAYGYQRDLARVMGPNAEADARLIRAAPDLLEALVKLEAFVSQFSLDSLGLKKIGLARAAIAEATGD